MTRLSPVLLVNLFLILLFTYSSTGTTTEYDDTFPLDDKGIDERKPRKESYKILNDVVKLADKGDMVTVYKPITDEIDLSIGREISYDVKTYTKNSYLGIPFKFEINDVSSSEVKLSGATWKSMNWQYEREDNIPLMTTKRELNRNKRELLFMDWQHEQEDSSIPLMATDVEDESSSSVKNSMDGQYEQEGSIPLMTTNGKSVLRANGKQVNCLESQWFVPDSRFICLSLMYRLNDADLNINAQYKGHSIEHVRTIRVDEAEKNLWSARTIIFPYKPNLENEEIRLLINCSTTINDYRVSSFSYIYNIMLCDPETDTDIYIRQKTDVIISTITKHPHYDKVLKVLRGINRAIEEESQRSTFEENNICYPGLTGDLCDKGCEANRFGRNCSRTCSQTNCRRMLFSLSDELCFCASGFKGLICDEPCDPGRYGPDCIKRCGHCKNGEDCDIYTGRCVNGCMDGYRMPLCKYEYKYLSLPVIVSDISYTTANIEVPFESIVGIGEPLYLRIMVKIEKYDSDWSLLLADRVIGSRLKNVTYPIENLAVGRDYVIKAILIDSDGGFKEDVLSTSFRTKCDDPEDIKYGLAIESTFTDDLENQTTIVWNQYRSSNGTICSPIGYDVYLKNLGVWQLLDEVPANKNSYTLMPRTELINGYTYPVRIRAVTSNGPLKFSFPVKIRYATAKGISVYEMNVMERGSNFLNITWRTACVDGESKCTYYISYQLAEQISCSLNSTTVQKTATYSKSNSTTFCTKIETTDCWMTKIVRDENNAVIENLKPVAKYYISIVSNEKTLSDTIFTAFTDTAVPAAAPQIVNDTLFVTSNAAKFAFNGYVNCSHINGFFKSYHVTLSETDRIVYNLTTKQTEVEFSPLKSSTGYEAKVYYVNDAGINASVYDSLKFVTKASLPSTVNSLVVYKKSHRTLTLRWNIPKNITNLTGFIISWNSNNNNNNNNGSSEMNNSVEPAKCIAWPDSYCYTIDGLTPRMRYDVQVRIKTKEYQNGGLPKIVSATTFEEVPEKPQNLTIDNKTSNSVAVSWKNPRIINGVLNLFMVNVEEIATPDVADCCKVFPNIEIPLKEEKFVYSTEINDLRPGATYVIGVACKTTWFGPPANITVQTLTIAPQHNN